MAIEGIFILLLLVGLWVYFYHDYNIKKEINENCGWGEEDYYCFCEKSESMAIKNKLESPNNPFRILGLDNASIKLDG